MQDEGRAAAEGFSPTSPRAHIMEQSNSIHSRGECIILYIVEGSALYFVGACVRAVLRACRHVQSI